MPEQKVSKMVEIKLVRNHLVELTKRHYLLLREARELMKNNDDIGFAFADISFSLGFRYKNGSLGYFNSENELHNLSIVCLKHTFNSMYVAWSSKPIIYPCQKVTN